MQILSESDSAENLHLFTDKSPDYEQLLNDTIKCQKFVDRVKEITKSLQTRLDSMMKEDKKATEEFASDPNVIVVKRTKKRRRVVPLPSATSTDTTPSAYPESLPHSAPSENVSNAAERYACSFAFPPIKIIPLTTNNQMPNLTGPIVTRFLDEFRLPDVAESNIAYWRIRSGNLLLFAGDRETFSQLLDERVYPRLIGSYNFKVEYPKKIPRLLSLLILGVPIAMNVEHLVQEIQQTWPSICAGVSQPTFKSTTSKNVRIDFRSSDDYKNCKQSGKVRA
ncbi:unnamed protein product, partial [Didymodactylos carnosus]